MGVRSRIYWKQKTKLIWNNWKRFPTEFLNLRLNNVRYNIEDNYYSISAACYNNGSKQNVHLSFTTYHTWQYDGRWIICVYLTEILSYDRILEHGEVCCKVSIWTNTYRYIRSRRNWLNACISIESTRSQWTGKTKNPFPPFIFLLLLVFYGSRNISSCILCPADVCVMYIYIIYKIYLPLARQFYRADNSSVEKNTPRGFAQVMSSVYIKISQYTNGLYVFHGHKHICVNACIFSYIIYYFSFKI